VHLFDSAGALTRPYVYRWIEDVPGSREYREDTSVAFPIRFFVDGFRYRIVGGWSSTLHLFGVDPAASVLLMGTDEYGRDQFARLLYGGQISLFAGPLAALISLSIALALGGLAGFVGGWLDDLIMAAVELFICVPWLYLLFGLRALLPLQLDSREAFFAIIVALGVIGWAKPARLVRGVVLSAKEREYVVAARGFGASGAYLLRRHILPQTRSVLVAQAAALIPRYILAEVVLSFLGLGINEPEASWGTLLGSLQKYHVLVSDWWLRLPALIVFAIFVSLHLLGQTLTQVEPRTRLLR
jgi:peptide/nickel transport system permease protein